MMEELIGVDIKQALMNKIYDMEKVAQALDIPPFEIFFLGGSGCILGDYIYRMTMDYDFVNLNYNANIGRALAILGDYDMVESELAPISNTMRVRAKKLTEFKYLDIYVLSREDIIVSKLCRFNDKDKQDIDILIKEASIDTIYKIVDEILNRDDINNKVKSILTTKINTLRKMYNV